MDVGGRGKEEAKRNRREINHKTQRTERRQAEEISKSKSENTKSSITGEATKRERKTRPTHRRKERSREEGVAGRASSGELFTQEERQALSKQ